MAETEFIAEPGKQDNTIIWVFDAPRDLVFRAYVDPVLISQWWSPENYTIEVEKMDVRPGGTWRINTKNVEGNDHWFRGVYQDISPPDRIVQTFEFEGMPGHASLETVTFEDLGGKTKVTDQAVFQTVEDRDGMIESMEDPGKTMDEIMNRLAVLLERMKAEKAKAA